MRRTLKQTHQLLYKVGGNNSKLRDFLYEEQKGICAYTDTFLGRTDKKEIDHFNPSLKGTQEDGFNNYFLVKAQWNLEKSSKWEKFQPIMHPTDEQLESRILYLQGDYIVADENDISAINLYELLKIGDPDLADERKRYIQRKKNDIEMYGYTASEYFEILLMEDRNEVSHIRAIQEEFDITLSL